MTFTVEETLGSTVSKVELSGRCRVSRAVICVVIVAGLESKLSNFALPWTTTPVRRKPIEVSVPSDESNLAREIEVLKFVACNEADPVTTMDAACAAWGTASRATKVALTVAAKRLVRPEK